jgi:hypothetical protein
MSGEQAHCEAANNCVEQQIMTMANTGWSKDLPFIAPFQGFKVLPQVPENMSGRPRLSTVGVRRPYSRLSTPYESESLALANNGEPGK